MIGMVVFFKHQFDLTCSYQLAALAPDMVLYADSFLNLNVF